MIKINYKCHSCNKSNKMEGHDAINFLYGDMPKEIPKGWSKSLQLVNNSTIINFINVYFCDKCTNVKKIIK